MRPNDEGGENESAQEEGGYDDHNDGDDDHNDGDGDGGREYIEGHEEYVTPTLTPKTIQRSRKIKGLDVRFISGILKVEPYPGGPKNKILLTSFNDHIALKCGLERKETH